MKELETIKKDLLESNRKIVESLEDRRSLGKASDGNDYDSEGRSFGRKGDSSRTRSTISGV